MQGMPRGFWSMLALPMLLAWLALWLWEKAEGWWKQKHPRR